MPQQQEVYNSLDHHQAIKRHWGPYLHSGQLQQTQQTYLEESYAVRRDAHPSQPTIYWRTLTPAVSRRRPRKSHTFAESGTTLLPGATRNAAAT